MQEEEDMFKIDESLTGQKEEKIINHMEDKSNKKT